MIKVIRKVYVAGMSCTLSEGMHELDKEVEATLLETRYAEAADPDAEADDPDADADADADVDVGGVDLSLTDEELKARLEPLNELQRNALWAVCDPELMAEYLVVRAGKLRKNWALQTMGNMIENHLGL